MDRPKVIVSGQASLDGRITTGPGVLLLYGDERWQAIAGSEDVYRQIMATHQPQVVLEGSHSFVPAGQPGEPLPAVEGDAVALYEDYLPESVVKRPGHRGWFTVVDGSGRVCWFYKEYPDEAWRGWHLLVLVHRQTPPEYLAYLQRERIPYLVAGQARVDLGGALAKLKAQLGVAAVLATSPGQLGGALLRAGLVDEIDLQFMPALVGGAGTPALFDGPALGVDEWPARLALISAEVRAGGMLRLRYAVRADS